MTPEEHEEHARKDKSWREAAQKSKMWALTLRTCYHCEDRASRFLGSLKIWVCEDCWREIAGKSNGMEHLRGRSGGSGTRITSDEKNSGPPGRMGYNGPSWDDIIRASEEDR